MSQKVMKRPQLGDPILRKKAKKLAKEDIASEQTQTLIKDMFYTLKRSGGIAIAAPQVGRSVRLAVLNIKPNKYHGKQTKRERFVIINPEIIKRSKKQTKMHEGCLSFIDLFGEVERPSQITVRYADQNGKIITRRLNGLVAKAFQHELDHLNGIVWVDRAKDTKTFMTKKMYLEQKTIQTLKEK